MWPKLRFLLIQTNSLYISAASTAAMLPSGWTRPNIPVAFGALDYLALYPGNSYICALPDATSTGVEWEDLQGGAHASCCCCCCSRYSFPLGYRLATWVRQLLVA